MQLKCMSCQQDNPKNYLGEQVTEVVRVRGSSEPIKRVALTGGIATGKSYVLSRFEEHGVPVVDADKIAREVVEPGRPILEDIIRYFGPQILDSSGRLNRQKLGKIVFSEPDKRRLLESLIHPSILNTIDSWFNSLDKNNHFGLVEVPLLYETGTQDRFDVVIVTACSLEEQVRRMVERTGMTKADANQRLAAQLSGKLGSTDQKIHQADFVIRTDGLFQDTDTQVLAIYQSFMRH